jgi:hypothetical protein
MSAPKLARLRLPLEPLDGKRVRRANVLHRIVIMGCVIYAVLSVGLRLIHVISVQISGGLP